MPIYLAPWTLVKLNLRYVFYYFRHRTDERDLMRRGLRRKHWWKV